jgi:ribosome-associated protein
MRKIPEHEFTFNFSRSSGPGGQNVNKLNTKATMVWDIENSSCYSQAHKIRFCDKYKRYLVDGKVVIKSQRYRSQSKNIGDCKEKLHELLLSVKTAPIVRRATKPSKSSIRKRLDNKKKQSLKKRGRSDSY